MMISKDDLGDKWPLTIDSIVVKKAAPCRLSFKHDGVEYQLTGNADGVPLLNSGLWKESPSVAIAKEKGIDFSGLKMNLGPLLQEAQRRCGCN